MKNIHHLPGAPETVEQPFDAEAVIEDYLDHLCAPLIAIVPFEARDRFREEVRETLESRYESYLEEGIEPYLAMQNALAKYGKSERMSARYLEEYLRYEPKGALHRAFGIANGWALIFFGQATLWCLIAAQLRIYFPSEAAYEYTISLANLRKYIPNPIPLPDASPWTYIFLGFVGLVPFIAGYLVGKVAVVDAARGVFNVLTLLIIGTFLLGVIMLPSTDGLFLAFAQMMWWLPVGCLTAHTTAAVEWRRRSASHSFLRRKS